MFFVCFCGLWFYDKLGERKRKRGGGKRTKGKRREGKGRGGERERERKEIGGTKKQQKKRGVLTLRLLKTGGGYFFFFEKGKGKNYIQFSFFRFSTFCLFYFHSLWFSFQSKRLFYAFLPPSSSPSPASFGAHLFYILYFFLCCCCCSPPLPSPPFSSLQSIAKITTIRTRIMTTQRTTRDIRNNSIGSSHAIEQRFSVVCDIGVEYRLVDLRLVFSWVMG